jgi:HPt (histidine-containing phosphotransfer) domain-containing protein
MIDFALLTRLEDQVGLAIVQRLTSRYSENAKLQRQKLVAALSAGNRDDLRFVAHQINGSAASFGLLRLTRAAAALENTAAEADETSLTEATEQVLGLLDSDPAILAAHFNPA